jgi:hypothetical protein
MNMKKIRKKEKKKKSIFYIVPKTVLNTNQGGPLEAVPNLHQF